LSLITTLLTCISTLIDVYVDDEKFDLALSISGSGPYIFPLDEAMMDWSAWVSPTLFQAATLVYRLHVGFFAAMETGEHPASPPEIVTSPSRNDTFGHLRT
jgi:pyrroline-5-carboxylate reductase